MAYIFSREETEEMFIKRQWFLRFTVTKKKKKRFHSRGAELGWKFYNASSSTWPIGPRGWKREVCSNFKMLPGMPSKQLELVPPVSPGTTGNTHVHMHAFKMRIKTVPYKKLLKMEKLVW